MKFEMEVHEINAYVYISNMFSLPLFSYSWLIVPIFKTQQISLLNRLFFSIFTHFI